MEGDVTRLEEADRVKGGGHSLGRHGLGPPPSANWAVITIKTECKQESGHLQSMYSLVCEKRPGVYTFYNPVVNFCDIRMYAIQAGYGICNENYSAICIQ